LYTKYETLQNLYNGNIERILTEALLI